MADPTYTCKSRQAPLRDTYISATEPVAPFDGNYVIINLDNCNLDGHTLNLNLHADVESANDANGKYWNIVPETEHWRGTYYQNTHCIRTWSNTSYFYTNKPTDPSGNCDVAVHSRRYKAHKYKTPEAQLGDAMFMHAVLNGMGSLSLDADNQVPWPLPLTPPNPASNLTELVRSNYYPYLNSQIDASGNTPGLAFIGGLNLSLFNIVARKTSSTVVSAVAPAVEPTIPYCIFSKSAVIQRQLEARRSLNYALTITIWPLISGAQSRNPLPAAAYKDWDGKADTYPFFIQDPSLNSVKPLPAIKAYVNGRQKCFYVWLPVQLYTLNHVGGTNPALTFSKYDITQDASDNFVNMESIALKLKGTFKDETGANTVIARDAKGIVFEIVSPNPSNFTLTHTYQENTASSNRPIYCFEKFDQYEPSAQEPYIPIFDSDVSEDVPCNPSLLFTPTCGPGIWSNLVEP